LPEHVFAKSAVQIVERRLSHLSPQDGEFLRMAAVGGRELILPVLQHIFPAADISQHLNTAADTGLLRVTEQYWQFSHDQLRTALLESVDSSTRADYHRQIASAFETVYANTLDQHAAYLAHHWQRAGNIECESY